MMGKRIMGWVVIMVFLGGLCLVVFKAKPPPVQSARLPDGNVVEFLRATYGTNHVMVWGKSYQKFLYKVFPAKLKQWAKCDVEEYSTSDTNFPVIWLYENRPEGDLNVSFVDEYGCEHDFANGGSGSSGLVDSGRIWYFYCVPVHSGRIVGFSVYDHDAKTNPPAVFRIPGACLAPMPQAVWPKPQFQEAGDISCQLINFVSGLSCFPVTNGVPFSQLVLRVRHNGVPIMSWHPERVIITDRHRESHEFTIETGRKGNDLVLNFDGVLAPTDGPFKFKLEMVHDPSDSYPDELLTIKHVPFPAAGQIIKLNLQAEIQSERIMLENIYGAKTNQSDSLEMRRSSIPDLLAPHVAARLEPPAEDVHFALIHVTDESGKETSNGRGSMWKGENYWFFLEQFKTAKSVDLTFAVSRSRFVEFEAMPALFMTNNMSKN